MIDLAIDALAAYRVTRLVTRDKIGEPFRDAVIRKAYAVDPRRGRAEWTDRIARSGHGLDVVVAHDDDAPKAAYLVTCPWCVGVYVATGMCVARAVLGRRRWDQIRRPAALAGLAALVQVWEQTR